MEAAKCSGTIDSRTDIFYPSIAVDHIKDDFQSVLRSLRI